jgi:hypothetical protein
MKNTNQNAQTLAPIIEEKISTPIYDTIIELYRADAERRNNGEMAPAEPMKTRQDIVRDYIEDALNQIENYNSHDLSDLSSIDFDYTRDTIANEYADGETEIYNYYLWKHAPILSDYIEDAMNEYGNAEEVIKTRGFIGLITQGEYYFYSQFINEIIDALEEIKEEEEEDND